MIIRKSLGGFTLIELMLVIAITAILATVSLTAVNPGRRFASARDVARRNDIYQVVNAVYQYSVENNGNYPPQIDAQAKDIGTGGLNLAGDLTPLFIPVIPYDPSNGSLSVANYVLFLNETRLIASATGELTPVITVSR